MKDDYIWFCVKLMDPYLTGFTDISQCEYIIELLFDNQDEDGNKTKPPKTQLPNAKATAKKVEIRSQPDNDSLAEAKEDSEDPSDSDGETRNDRDEL